MGSKRLKIRAYRVKTWGCQGPGDVILSLHFLFIDKKKEVEGLREQGQVCTRLFIFGHSKSPNTISHE